MRYAVALGKATLNHYYELTDWATVYGIAMGESFRSCYFVSVCSGCLVLHPQHKLEYFKKLEWQEEWIANARELTRTTFARDYAHVATESVATAPAAASKVRTHLRVIVAHSVLTCNPLQPDDNIFNTLPVLTVETAIQDELSTYLAEPCERMPAQDLAGLMWWYDHHIQFPRLSRMARDYLCIPGVCFYAISCSLCVC